MNDRAESESSGAEGLGSAGNLLRGMRSAVRGYGWSTTHGTNVAVVGSIQQQSDGAGGAAGVADADAAGSSAGYGWADRERSIPQDAENGGAGRKPGERLGGHGEETDFSTSPVLAGSPRSR